MDMILPISFKVSSTAMDNVRETIHQNELDNQIAHRVRSVAMHLFFSKAILEQTLAL